MHKTSLKIAHTINGLLNGSEFYRRKLLDNERYVGISYEWLSQEIGERYGKSLSPKTIRKYFAILVENGILSIKKIERKSFNWYAINAANLARFEQCQKKSKKCPSKAQKSSDYAGEISSNLGGRKSCIISLPKKHIKTALKSAEISHFSKGNCKKNSPHKYIYKSNKSNNLKNNLVKEELLVTKLHALAKNILGEKVATTLNKQLSIWLHAAFKKLGSCLEKFETYLREFLKRNWVMSQRWFTLKWILKFTTMDKILSGALLDFVKSTSWYSTKQAAPVPPQPVKQELVKGCEVASHYYRLGEFPEGATQEQIRDFINSIKASNPTLARALSEEHLGISCAQSTTYSNFVPSAPAVESVPRALKSLLSGILGEKQFG